jgi:hypothetical protein
VLAMSDLVSTRKDSKNNENASISRCMQTVINTTCALHMMGPFEGQFYMVLRGVV